MAHDRRDPKDRASSTRLRDDEPRLYLRGRYWQADLRPWGGTRTTLRDPTSPGWPHKGERTESRAQARRWVWAYVDQLEGKTPSSPGRPRSTNVLQELRDDYLRYRQHVSRVSRNTIGSDRTTFRALIRYFGDVATTADLTAHNLQAFFDHFLMDGYEPSTVRQIRNRVGSLLKWLKQYDALVGIELPAPAPSDVRPWDDDELRAIRRAADKLDRIRRKGGPPYRRIVELALATGARQKEIFAIQWTDFRPPYGIRIVRQQRNDSTETVALKDKQARTSLVMPEWFESGYHGERGWVVTNSRDNPIGGYAQDTLINRLLDTAGLNEWGVAYHRFRHTYARLFLERGGTLEDLRNSLGHTSIRTTEETYGHLSQDFSVERAARAIHVGRRPALSLR